MKCGKSKVLIGLQYGDEGKARVLDKIIGDSQIVARFNGGANAGHTLEVGETKIALHQIPSGIFYENVKLYIGSGCVVNPKKTVEEIRDIMGKNIDISNRLYISGNCSLVCPYHLILDSLYGKSIGTTGNGIGPAYSDQALRAEGLNIKNIKIGDFLSNSERFEKVVMKNLESVFLKHSLTGINKKKLMNEFLENTINLRDYVCKDPLFLENLVNKGENVFFEGANSIMLDPVSGVVPYVTSSRTLSGAAYVGGDLGVKHHDKVIGVCKAIMSRVGNGPFITEFGGKKSEDYCSEKGGYAYVSEVEAEKYDANKLLKSKDLFELGCALRMKGGEYGATTKRPRRMGMLDLVMLRQNSKLNSVDELYINKVDCLRDFSETSLIGIPVVTSYILDGNEIDYLPTSEEECRRVEPVVEYVSAFDEDISKIRKYDQLPRQVKSFVGLIEFYVGIPVCGIGVGPERDQFVKK